MENEKEKESCMDMDMVIKLELGGDSQKYWVSTFNLEKAICNHGFFMMPPNQWNPSTKSFHRPLRLSDSSNSVNVSISHHHHPHDIDDDFLLIRVHHHTLPPGHNHLSTHDQIVIKEQVRRMLRISEKDERDVKEFHKLHNKAKQKGFGRLFRSPSLFEDCIKSLLLCNTMWDKTLCMAAALCELQVELNSTSTEERIKQKKSSRKRPRKNSNTQQDGQEEEGKFVHQSIGNFPNSKELANMDLDLLKKRCKLGYRAKYIRLFARKVENGQLKLENFEQAFNSSKPNSYNEGFKTLMKIQGFGSYTCANVAMCLGYYEKVPADTETSRLLHEVHSTESSNRTALEKNAKAIYDKYAPFQCLAYWLDLVDNYESKFGKLSEMDRFDYYKVTKTVNEVSQSQRMEDHIAHHQDFFVKKNMLLGFVQDI